MAQVTIWLPDNLQKATQDADWLNVSQVCQIALVQALANGPPAKSLRQYKRKILQSFKKVLT